jgi:hypothetical protein
MQYFAVQSAGSTPERVQQDLWGERRRLMHIALAVAFGMIAVAPFFGRWRANVWLKKHMSEERTVKSIPEAA